MGDIPNDDDPIGLVKWPKGTFIWLLKQCKDETGFGRKAREVRDFINDLIAKNMALQEQVKEALEQLRERDDG